MDTTSESNDTRIYHVVQTIPFVRHTPDQSRSGFVGDPIAKSIGLTHKDLWDWTNESMSVSDQT